MDLKALCQKTHSIIRTPLLNYTREYVKIEPDIRKAISNFSGVKTDLTFDCSKKAESNLLVSLILSDFTSVFPFGGSDLNVIILEKSSPHFPKHAVLTQNFVDELFYDNGEPVCKPAYVLREDEQAQNFIRQAGSLMESGRMMIRSTPFLMGLTKEERTDGRRVWKMHNIEPDMPGDIWFVADEEKPQTAIPFVEREFNSEFEDTLCSFTLPYLEGLSFETLSTVLDDEQDLLTEFRKNVREMLKEIKNDPANSIDLLNDLVRPSTDKVERKFKSITNIHRLKIAGASIGTATLFLAALTNAGVASALSGILGAGGLGLMTKEYADYLKNKAELKEMPFYLLWRFKHENQK
jgi:hypothetical protein